MDMNMARPIVDDLFKGRSTVGKHDLMQAASRLGLPTNYIQSLPDKQYSKDEVLQLLSRGEGGLSDIERKIA